ncbi:MAG: Vegetative protein [Myxococcaceae bacterium]|nr:Vegetative protein [Myxococcaceae bacterium]
MSFDKILRDMIREEISAVIAPITEAIAQLRDQGTVAAQLSSLLGGGVKRGPGRPRKNALLLLGAGKAARRGAKGKRTRGSNDRGCAIIGCKRPARSKGYCAAHYQKYRMLTRTKRLPSDWAEHAEPGTVRDMVLPRGRAGAKALAEARKK